MKHLLFILFISCTVQQTIAQDPDLLDNEWYLEELVIDSEVIPALSFPPEPKIGRIEFTNEFVRISFCDQHTAVVVYDVTEDIFTLDLLVTLGEGCERQENVDFETIYLSVFLEDDIFKNPFSYDILPKGGGVLGLIITNVDGDQAVYGNELLSAPTQDILSFKVYPNPVGEELTVSSPNNEVLSVEIYDINGKKVDTFQSENQASNKLNVSSLGSGIYFLKIHTEVGLVTKKIIKK